MPKGNFCNLGNAKVSPAAKFCKQLWLSVLQAEHDCNLNHLFFLGGGNFHLFETLCIIYLMLNYAAVMKGYPDHL